MPVSASSRTALVLFCRRPMAGSGKQRLARVLGERPALAVAQALLECALEDAAAWPGHLVVAPARAEDAAWAEALLPRPKWVIPQPEGNLGQRINAIDTAVRRQGCAGVLFIGSDAPSMQSADLEAAAATLEDSDVVLIPAADGGVTLMGCRAGWPPLARLPWSEAGLGAALERCCQQARMTVRRLPASYDIDEVCDFSPAIEMLAGDPRTARRRLRALLPLLVEAANGAARTAAAVAEAQT